MYDILRVARRAGSISIVGLAKWVQGLADSFLNAVALVAGAAAAIFCVLFAVVINWYALFVRV